MATAELKSAPAAGPLTANHLRELAAATERGRLIRKAARVAAFNGWTTGVLAAASGLFALAVDRSLVGFLVTAGLAVVASNELRGRKRLLAYDPAAPTLLGWNQLGLLAMIVVYCVWMIATNFTASGEVIAQLRAMPEVNDALGSYGGLDALWRQLVLLLYGGVIVLSVLFQGGNALYYFSRRKHVDKYVRDTPDWVRNLQRANANA